MSKKVPTCLLLTVLCICKASSEELPEDLVAKGAITPVESTDDSTHHKTISIDDENFHPQPDKPNLVSPKSGAIYVRWGRTECTPDSDLVYSGRAAGSQHRDLPGAGSNVLCVPFYPLFVNPVAGVGGTRAFLYSVEYQISDFPLYQNYNSHDVTCAVCKATGRYSHLMIPGKPTCPSNEWTLEYHGYLMAERSHSAHHRSEFLCMDKSPRSAPGSVGWANVNSGRLAVVEATCSTSGGGLPCGPYPSGSEFTCAVCTI